MWKKNKQINRRKIIMLFAIPVDIDNTEIEALRRALEQKSFINTHEFFELMRADISWHRYNLQRKHGASINLDDALINWALEARKDFFDYWAPKMI